MKTRHPSFLFFMILMALSSHVLLIGDRTNGEAAQNGQTLPITEMQLTPLGPENDNPPVPPTVLPLLKEQMTRIARKLMTQEGGPEHIKDLGFTFGSDESIDKFLEAIELDENRFPIYEVSLNKLRTFAPGTNIENLLVNTGQLLYPIKVKQEVKSSMTLRCVRDRQTGETCWRLTRVGLPNLISRITKARYKLSTQKPGLQQDFRLVSIPALNRNFLYYQENAVIRLVPLAKDHHFTEGESYLAQDVIKWLSEEAMSVDDSPR
jgi:hypothetical protein